MLKGIYPLLLAALLFITPKTGISQHNPYGCGTAEAVAQAIKDNPKIKQQLEEAEREYAEISYRLAHGEIDKSIWDTVLVIPVVVHIMHTYGGDNISKAQVLDAIRIINQDFSKTARDTANVTALFKPIHGNPRMEFRLATRDPNGNCTEGITRTYTQLTLAAGENVKQLISWPTEKYFNIWVVSRIASGAGGYAYYPGSAPSPSQEGVVVVNSQFGSIGTSGGSNFSARTMTHEIGHYFNLPHTWGSSNTPGSQNNCNIDDGVTDTPNTVGVVGQGCPLTMPSCAGDPVRFANVENYMDYSNCGRMFTLGQCTRMRTAALSTRGRRSSLWQQSNLIATGTAAPYLPSNCAPIGLIIPSINATCTGFDVRLNGYAYNANPDSLQWKWILPTAVQDTLYGRYPVARYATPGSKDVTLIVFNRVGADTILVNDAYSIADSTSGLFAPAAEGFETPGFPATGQPMAAQWQVDGTNAGLWQQTTSAFNTGSASFYLPMQQARNNESNFLTSPRISLRGLTRPAQLSFAHAFASTVDTGNNRLIVSVSTDCGGSWQQIYNRSRSSTPKLITNTGGVTLTAPFVPTANEWRMNYVNIDRYLAAKTVTFRFEVQNEFGNAIYLDNINIGTNLISNLNGTRTGATIQVFPNPLVKGNVFQVVGDGLTDHLNFWLVNIAGQIVASSTITDGQIRLPDGLPNGAYNLRIGDYNSIKTNQTVIIAK